MNHINSTLTIGSLHDSKIRQSAAQVVKDGGVIGVFNRGVNALWLDASNPKATLTLQNIKGEGRKGKPVALTIGLDKLIEMVDMDKLSQEGRDFFEISEDLKKEIGSLCFIRVPIKKKYHSKIPRSSISQDDEGTFWIQTWDPHGHDPTEDLIKTMHKLGVKYPAVSSMNKSGEPEIVPQTEGENFCKNAGLSYYLKDEKVDPLIQGSYTIITFSKKGIELTRDGNIPGWLIEPIFGSSFIRDNTKLSNYLQKSFPKKLIDGLSSKKGIRMAILLYLEGGDPLEINGKVKQLNL